MAGGPDGGAERVFVEVKSSTSLNKRSFEVSTQELVKAQQEGSRWVGTRS
jgi:hypothetical protein